MPVKYKIVKRSRPGHPDVPAKYYPSLQATGRVSTNEIAREASDMCTLTTADMVAAIEALMILILPSSSKSCADNPANFPA